MDLKKHCTFVTAVDRWHLKELKAVWPTWLSHKPEFSQMRGIIIYDSSQLDPKSADFDRFRDSRISLIPWDMPEVNQREKMLTSLVKVPGQVVTTEWYLKIDTDAFAINNKRWYYDDWFSGNEVFVTSPWSYTKPPDAIDRLDQWANQHPELSHLPSLNIHPEPGKNKIIHPRIISWLFFCRTAWSKRVAEYCPGRLPVPSQDTYFFYCAKRRGDNFRTVRMKRFGWEHSAKKVRKL